MSLPPGGLDAGAGGFSVHSLTSRCTNRGKRPIRQLYPWIEGLRYKGMHGSERFLAHLQRLIPCQDAAGVRDGYPHQVLLGVTGSGKTFTVANAIGQVNRSTLVFAPNKTL